MNQHHILCGIGYRPPNNDLILVDICPLTERQTRLNSLVYWSRRKIMKFRQPDVYDHHMTFQNKRTYASKLLKTGLLVGRDSTS